MQRTDFASRLVGAAYNLRRMAIRRAYPSLNRILPRFLPALLRGPYAHWLLPSRRRT